ncbi:PREDICTED: uncharacterized protein LOC106748836 [Dinoponera quadriceps]|uniref:Uncharacterized protein LOC106748836 n=1 Tax=Dinoponera quadriceps TaxID=609295 RepID=A0A6P3XYP2_DINQU|nr:PREDICTED: uncharacterized protein LOC106748836 [Dinoponera quadriceps]
MKSLIDKIQCNYDDVRDKNETTILNKYANKAKRYTVMLTETHQYLILLHGNVAFCIACFVLLSTGTILLSYGQHICGMFKIASYRIQNAIKPAGLRLTNPLNENSIYEKLIYAVDVHRKTLQLIFLMLSSANVELVIQLILLISQYLYMFWGNYVAQQVADHNNYMFITVYNIQWYMASLQVQKMILFMLQKGTKAYYLQLGNIFVGSLEGFASLLSATISYFTVIYSTRQ